VTKVVFWSSDSLRPDGKVTEVVFWSSDFLSSVRPSVLLLLETRLQCCCSVSSSSCSSLAQLRGLWARERVTTVKSFKKECCGSLSNCRASIDAEWVVIWSSPEHIKEGKKATESGVIGGEGGRIEDKQRSCWE
jgi:hypothetical protein